jgi:uncharacterized protein
MNANLRTNRPQLATPWIYFAATFIWTWSLWGLAILTGSSMETGQGAALLLLGVTGPMVVGIALVYLTRDKEGRRDYWNRITNFKRIAGKWYLVIFLFVPVLHLLSALLDCVLGGGGTTWGEAALGMVSNPLSLITTILFACIIPIIEELGWRGYVLDRLQERRSALVSSLILGVLWSLWHLPMFFIEGSYQAGLGIGTLTFWIFFLSIVPLTFVITWIYNHTERSTLSAILFHSMVNFTGEMITLSKNADTIYSSSWFVVAIAITVIWGAQTFTGKKDARS